MEKCLPALLVGAALLVATPASASVIVLDFKGIVNLSPVGDFDDGGGETSYGVEFSPGTLAVVDEDAGGTRSIAGDASLDAEVFPQEANDSSLDVPAGFDTGLSSDTSPPPASVNVYDGLDATDNVLETLSLVAPASDNCTGLSSGELCNWMPVGVAVGGVTKSIDVGGTTSPTTETATDTTTSGRADPVESSVAKRAMLALLGASLVLAAVVLGRRHRSARPVKGRRREHRRVVVRGVR